MKSRMEIVEEVRNLARWNPGAIGDETARILLDIAGDDEADMMSEMGAIDYLHALEEVKPEAVSLARDFLFPVAPPKTVDECLDSISEMLGVLAKRNPHIREGLNSAKETVDRWK